MPGRVKADRAGGFSLVELMVAVLVLSIAVVGLFRVFGSSAGQSGTEASRQLALIVAQNRAEEIALGIPALPDRVELAGRDWIVTEERSMTSGGFERIELAVSPAGGGSSIRLVTFASRATP